MVGGGKMRWDGFESSDRYFELGKIIASNEPIFVQTIEF